MSGPSAAVLPAREAASSAVHRAYARWREMRPPPLLPLVVLAVFLVLAVFAPLVAPHSPVDGMLGRRLLPPSGIEGARPEHLLGTDRLGRDVLSRLVFGAQISLSLSLVAIAITSCFGASIGLLAGYIGGWAENLIMRVTDVSLSLPGILFAVLLAVVFRPSFANVVVVVVFMLWPSYARLVRAETLGLKHAEFVDLARVAGCSPLTIARRHIWPNVVPSILVLATLQVGQVIVLEASLSFLGVGVPPPTPSWGVMVADGRGLIESAWWIAMIPGSAILLTVVSLNICGDWVRDRLDPKLRQV